MRATLIIMAILILLSANVMAGERYAGTSAPVALRMEITPSVVATGGAAVARLHASSEAVVINPAGIWGAGESLSFTHIAGMQFVGYDQLTVAGDIGAWGNYGAALLYSGKNPMIYGQNGEQLASIPMYDLAGTIAYAQNFAHEQYGDITGGLATKLIYSRIQDSIEATYAFDLGLQYSPPILSQFMVGFAVQNLGPGLNRYDPLPWIVRSGISYDTNWDKTNQELGVGLDLLVPRDEGVNGRLGAEYRYCRFDKTILIGRIGVKTNPNNGWLSALAFGAGVSRNLEKFGFLQLDYTLVPQGSLGIAHRLSLGAKF